MQPVAVTITSGSTVSGDASLPQGTPYGIWCPVLTSGDLFIRASYDQTSANYVRIQSNAFGAAPVSGDLRLGVGPGSAMVLLPTNFQWPSTIRIESAVSQTAARTFQLLYRSRMPT